MSIEMLIEYRIFKFTTQDWDDTPMSEMRKGAPLYGLFDIHRNSKGEICGRNTCPVLIFDTYLEEGDHDPIAFFQAHLATMQEGIRQPVLEEPYGYGDSECMTDEEFKQFMAEQGLSVEPEGDT